MLDMQKISQDSVILSYSNDYKGTVVEIFNLTLNEIHPIRNEISEKSSVMFEHIKDIQKIMNEKFSGVNA